jgi:hypothetical protein
MKKWIPILLGSIGSFFILKSILKFDKSENKVVISPIKTEEVRRAIPVIEKVVENPTTNASKVVPAGPYLESGKVSLNSKR